MAYAGSYYQNKIMSYHENDEVEKEESPRKSMDMGNARPIWNLAMHCKKRYVNEELKGYTYSPRAGGTKLPTLRNKHLADKRTFPKVKNSCELNPSPTVVDSLPPLKFHASVDSYPFPKRPLRVSRWAFQDRDESSPRFQNQTFRIFRPMLYSVLLTNKILPQIKTTPTPKGSSNSSLRSSSSRDSTKSEQSGTNLSKDASS